ncbi:hypothetical protein [Streptomyces albiflavescens]|uniref:hypothetical protein n=1 Tax=Streptomyces albiflavescens TaxID=1623582 RepID=UPI00166B12B1|nr:hypothetical protein [Streptomyces albiflavescens]
MDAFEQVAVAIEEGAVNPSGSGETGDGDVPAALGGGVDGLEDAFSAAGRVGWLALDHGVGHPAGLSGRREKIAQLDARQERRSSKVFLEVPSFDQSGARTGREP